MPLSIGTLAPDLSGTDARGHQVRLADFRGRRHVAVVFFPFAFAGLCANELEALEALWPSLDALGASVVGVSCDSPFTQARWAEERGLPFPLLSDFWPHGAIARAFGVFDEVLGCANRATFVVDTRGVIAAYLAAPDLGTPRAMAQLEEALATLEVAEGRTDPPGGSRR